MENGNKKKALVKYVTTPPKKKFGKPIMVQSSDPNVKKGYATVSKTVLPKMKKLKVVKPRTISAKKNPNTYKAQ